MAVRVSLVTSRSMMKGVAVGAGVLEPGKRFAPGEGLLSSKITVGMERGDD